MRLARTRAPTFSWLALVALLACAGSSPPRAAEPVTPPASSDFAAALDRYFVGQFRADEPGGAVLVMKRDRIVFAHAYGLADLRTREPATTRTLFNVGSITKPFV